MRVMWMSNAPWAGTGYGVQTKYVLHALQELGHEVSCFAFYGLHGGRIPYDGYTVWPASDFDPWGSDVINAHVEQAQADVLVTLMDPFVLDVNVWSKLKVPWVAWVPIDCDTIGFPTLDKLKIIPYPVAMSQHGAAQMREEDIMPAATIYHAVDTELFKPLDKWECRRELGIDEDCFLIGMVMANKGDRKQFPRHFEAIRKFIDTRPEDNIRIYMHTDPTEKMGGWDMRALIAKFGLTGKVYGSGQYYTSVVSLEQDKLTQIYNSLDVLMNCSSGEGFGVPIVEAQACGIPVITHDVTSMPEITWNGWTVKSDTRALSAHFGFQYGPSVEDMVYRLECAYRYGKKDSVIGRQTVIERCSIPVIAQQWHDLLKEVHG